MRKTAAKIGYYASLASFLAAAGYSLAQIAQVLGAISYPLADILIFGTSLCIAVPFPIVVLALHDVVDEHRRLWARGALLFSVMYATYAALVYTVQLGTVIPGSPDVPAAGVLAVSPQSMFWDIDALAYIAMGISTTFMALSLPQAGRGAWARALLLANGFMTPVIVFIYFYPHFSTAILLVGSPWIITAPGSLLALAIFFRSAVFAAKPSV